MFNILKMKKIFYISLLVLIIGGCTKETTIEPQLLVSTDSLVFNGNEMKKLILSTKPANKCEYQIISHPDWLKFSSKSGVINNSLENIQISSDFSNFLPGKYDGKIEIISTLGNKIVYVKGYVGEQLQYTLPDSLLFSVFESNKGVVIKNEGNVPLTYSITTSNNLISITSLSGSVLVGKQNNIEFTANRVNMVSGKYYAQIYLNINDKLDTIDVCIEHFKEQKIKLTTNVVDAEYSKVKDIIVFVSSSPSTINIYNTLLGTTSSLNLNYNPTCVSVSSDGTNAVVGHDGYITYVDLTNKTIIKSFSVSCNALDIVLGNNKWAYVFPKVDQWEKIRCIRVDLTNDNEVLQTGNSIYAGTKAKLHPSGKFIYGTNNGLSPSDIEKYDIQTGGAKYLYDSPYHGDYPINGDLWFSEDGSRVFTKGGTVLRTSEIRDQDMKYNGKIILSSNSSLIMWLDHSAIRSNLYIVSTINDPWSNQNAPSISVYNSSNLTFKGIYDLEKYFVPNNMGGGNFYVAEPYFVFSNSTGDNIFVLTKAKDSGLANEWAIQKIAVD